VCEIRNSLAVVEPLGTSRPLTARSVIASTLLGSHPPRLSSQLLVRSGELFGIAEGTTRTAISRMVAAGELEPDDNAFRLAGALLARQSLQDAGRRGERRSWSGTWELAVVSADRRSATDRAELRRAMRRLKLGELREGVWLRPDNLDAARSPEDRAVVDAQCRMFTGRPDDDPSRLASTLWDLSGWAGEARSLIEQLDDSEPPFTRGDTDRLRGGFVLSAAVLRHLLADPLLPPDLVPPDWPGGTLRETYERYDAAFQRVWRAWFRVERVTDG
jgi:phenylacetic acid degradation operon negative regulatory protein